MRKLAPARRSGRRLRDADWRLGEPGRSYGMRQAAKTTLFAAGTQARYRKNRSRFFPMNEEQHALREAETLCQVVEEISSEVELRPLLTRIVTHACELLGADDGAIGLVDPSRRKVRTEAVYRMPMLEQGAEHPVNVGLTGAVLARGEPLLLDRYGDLPEITLPELADNAVIGVPIKSHGRLVGVFGIGARPPRKFHERDLATLQLFARHAARSEEHTSEL